MSAKQLDHRTIRTLAEQNAKLIEQLEIATEALKEISGSTGGQTGETAARALIKIDEVELK